MHFEPLPPNSGDLFPSQGDSAAPSLLEQLARAERTLAELIGEKRSSPPLERAFLRALQGHGGGTSGDFAFQSEVSERETVLVVVDTTGANPLLKYVFAESAGRTFIVAAPISWTEYHRELVARVKAATGEDAQCTGGGFVRLTKSGRFWIGGDSSEFGAGNHGRAEAALSRVLNRRDPSVG